MFKTLMCGAAVLLLISFGGYIAVEKICPNVQGFPW